MAQRVYGPRQKPERTPKKGRKAKRPGGSDKVNEGEQPEEQGGQSTDNFERVKLFMTEHPGAKVREVAQALAISRTTANKWMTRLREAQ
jgi:hypothetical protein